MRMLKTSVLFVPLLALAIILVGLPAVALGRDDGQNFRATLIGINETPSINTDGTANLKLTLNATSIDFTLTYQNLSLAPKVAHIHFGQARTAGGVMVFFCGGGGQPACPSTTSGTITGTIVAANVQAIPTQGIVAGDLGPVLRAIRSGAAYANMHTPPNFPAGEIRGQIQRSED
jgi:CHRD domain-containing protein